MGKSPLVLLCFVPLMIMGQTHAHSISKTITVYGPEQGSHPNVNKHSTNQYMLQVGSFDIRSNALKYRNEIAKLVGCPVQIISTKSTLVKYRVIIGPIRDATNLIKISNRLLAHRSKPSKLRIPKSVLASSKKSRVSPQKSKIINGLRAGLEHIRKPVKSKELQKGAVQLAQAKQLSAKQQKPVKLDKSKPYIFKPIQDTYAHSLLPELPKSLKENNEKQDVEKNLFLGAIDEPRRQGWANNKGRTPDLLYPLAKGSIRDKKLATILISPSLFPTLQADSSILDTFYNRHEAEGIASRETIQTAKKIIPLAQLAVAETPIPLNLPSATDMELMDKHISFIDHKNRKIQINLDRYDRNSFALAYQVFILNSKVGYAFKIAHAAVQNEPKNVKWREKLAETALWTGNGEVALEQWMYLISNNITPEKYIPQALTLAKQLFNYDAQAVIYHYELQKRPDNKELLLNYNIATQNRGYPGKALKMLKEIPGSENDQQFLEQFVAISAGTDQPEQEFHYLQELVSLDKANVKARLKQAEILYSRGDLDGAFNVYSEVATETTNPEFWKDYAEIASLTGHVKATIIAFKKLLEYSSLNVASSLQLIQLEQLEGHLIAAYQDAKTIHLKHPDFNVSKLIISLGADLNKWHEIKQFIDSLPAKDQARLNNIPEYAVLIAITNRHVGLAIEAFQNWQRILSRWPQSTLVQRSLLWFLIDNNEIRQLEYVLSAWCKIFGAKPELWEVYATALTDIGNTRLALRVAKPHWEEINKDYARLLAVADLFVQNNNSYAAHYLQRRAVYLLLNEISPNTEQLSSKQYLAFSELMRTFAPASLTYNVILKLSDKLFKQPTVDDQITAWALETDNYDLSGIIIKTHALTGKYTPPWMSLTQALEEDDRDLMQLLLSESPNLLPHRDRVTAAARVGNFELAEEYAYQGLSEHPYDSEMYELFTDTMLPRSSLFFADQAIQTYGNVTGPLSRLKSRFFVTPSLALTPYGVAWFPHTTSKTVIASTPSSDETVGIKLRKYVEHGWWDVNLAERKGLAHTMPARVKWHRDNIYPRLDADLSLAYHVKTNNTTALLLGGMKNEAYLGLLYGLKSHNLYHAKLSFDQYLGQDGFYLGSGRELRLHWQHKLYLSYPDWNFNLYGNWLKYKTSNSNLPRLLQRLVPINQDPTTNFYMPQSDVNTAITFGFGQQYKEQYTQKWKAFAEAGLTFSKLLGMGRVIEGGVATSIFGRDHLVLHVEYAVNQQQVNQVVNQTGPTPKPESQIFYNIGISYGYYF